MGSINHYRKLIIDPQKENWEEETRGTYRAASRVASLKRSLVSRSKKESEETAKGQYTYSSTSPPPLPPPSSNMVGGLKTVLQRSQRKIRFGHAEREGEGKRERRKKERTQGEEREASVGRRGEEELLKKRLATTLLLLLSSSSIPPLTALCSETLQGREREDGFFTSSILAKIGEEGGRTLKNIEGGLQQPTGATTAEAARRSF